MDKEVDPNRAAVNRATANYMLRRLEQGAVFADEQVASQSKWLNASLLAVNSAGLIAVMQATADQRNAWAAGAFVLGAGLALLGGVVTQEAYLKRYPEGLRRRLPYWTEVSVTGVRDDETENGYRAEQKQLDWIDVVAPGVGYLSGLLWLAGAAMLALNLPS